MYGRDAWRAGRPDRRRFPFAALAASGAVIPKHEGQEPTLKESRGKCGADARLQTAPDSRERPNASSDPKTPPKWRVKHTSVSNWRIRRPRLGAYDRRISDFLAGGRRPAGPERLETFEHTCDPKTHDHSARRTVRLPRSCKTASSGMEAVRSVDLDRSLWRGGGSR